MGSLKRETNMTAEEKIKQYGKTILYRDLTVEQLIASHSYLRELNKRSIEDYRKSGEDGYEQGRKQGYEEVTNNEYIAVSKLRSMTIGELAEFVFDESS
jgi:flagellar biosynthesis/type III secretory pathway protein FliH